VSYVHVAFHSLSENRHNRDFDEKWHNFGIELQRKTPGRDSEQEMWTAASRYVEEDGSEITRQN